ncbi:MAG: hypothetical protein GF329_09305 [Candidatus Lokiarchaeota archaeon]|nr:hypothetical protein [Candidatus Lokiarchaeota archaeon]
MIPKFHRILGRVLLHILYLILRIFGTIKREQFSRFISRDIDKEKNSRGSVDESKRLIIIDDDVGMFWEGVWDRGHFWVNWLRITDPDGGLELIYALRDPNVKVLGITVMMGVAPMNTCLQAAKRILKVLDMEEIPVIPGAKTADDLGKETDAARFIVDMVKKYPNRVELIATGPLTNIATALMIEPELPKYWKTLHFATGEFRGALGKISDLFLPSLIGIPDLNTNVDVEATKYVVENAGEFPIYPNEIMDEISLDKDDYYQIRDMKTRIAEYIIYELRIHNFLFNELTPLAGGMIPHGVVPAGIILEEGYDECEFVKFAIEVRDYGHQGHAFVLSNDPSLPKHKIYYKMNKNFKEKLYNTLIDRLT